MNEIQKKIFDEKYAMPLPGNTKETVGIVIMRLFHAIANGVKPGIARSR